MAVAALAFLAGAEAAVAGQPACQQALDAAERGAALPVGLLKAIAAAESGRADPATGQVSPWPWTINAGGVGHYYASKADAIDAVQVYRALGNDSIDVGCMQINLRHHPAAFASLDEAFDPVRNVAYGALFLQQLYQRTGTWAQAVAAYHSQTPELGAEYWARVSARWPSAERFAGVARQPAQTPEDQRAARNRTPAFAAMLREAEEDHRRNLANARVSVAERPLPPRRSGTRSASLP